MFNQLANRFAMDAQGFSSPQFQAGSHENPYKNIWPYWYTFDKVSLSPNTSANVFFTVTQEAAFTWLSTTVQVYEVFGAPGAETLVAIDRNNYDIFFGEANPVTITVKDPQSQRLFHSGNMPIDGYGYGMRPSQLPRGILFMPNSQLQCILSNTDPARKFLPYVTLFGYRTRVDLTGNLIKD